LYDATTLRGSAPATQPETPFQAGLNSRWERLVLLNIATLRLPNLPESVVGNGWRSGERGDRPHAAQAERVCITYRFVFIEYNIISKANFAKRG
jgi:hypothetical protein